jgi:hypothetical protein
MKRLCAALASCALAPPLLAAGDAELQRCRAITAEAARLACYDALFGPPIAPAAAPSAAGAAAALPPSPAPNAARNAAPNAAPTPAPAGPAAVAAFGLQQPASPVDEITSHIPGRFSGWEPGARITLANGQVWQIADRSRGVYRLDDPKVKVRKGAMGSFFLEIEGQNQSPRVRRVQ